MILFIPYRYARCWTVTCRVGPLPIALDRYNDRYTNSFGRVPDHSGMLVFMSWFHALTSQMHLWDAEFCQCMPVMTVWEVIFESDSTQRWCKETKMTKLKKHHGHDQNRVIMIMLFMGVITRTCS